MNDADVEMSEWRALGQASARAEADGLCTHDSVVGWRPSPIYRAQEGLQPGEQRCRGCGVVFPSETAWLDAMQDVLDDYL